MKPITRGRTYSRKEALELGIPIADDAISVTIYGTLCDTNASIEPTATFKKLSADESIS